MLRLCCAVVADVIITFNQNFPLDITRSDELCNSITLDLAKAHAN